MIALFQTPHMARTSLSHLPIGRKALAAALWLCLSTSPISAVALAQEQPEHSEDNRALLERISQLEHAMANMQAELAAIRGKALAHAAPVAEKVAAPAVVAVATSKAATASAAKHGFMEKKSGKDLTFYTPNGEVTAYGNFDVSFDSMTKGISSLKGPDGRGPIGNLGWLPDLSTNLSYAGIRGLQHIGGLPLNLIYQLETEINITSTSGISESNSSQSNAVKGGLTSRNSFIGLNSLRLGSMMFGKTDAPYKTSTARLNPFVAMIGDYAVVMGNTGGDNRVEFSTRLDHSVWYTSPTRMGFRADVLFSPGQNRASDSNNIAAGESDCTGGNIPGSGGSIPFACNDGSFSNAVSGSLTYTHEPLYLVAAYEWHQKVNRASDLTGIYATPPVGYLAADVADEDAGKVGVQYSFPSKTTVSALFETMHRYVPGYLEFQNERQRLGNWLAVTQPLGQRDSVSLGWAHAYRAPGDPGQHNTSKASPPFGVPGDETGGRAVDNSANMITAAYRHKLGEGLTAYFAWAGTFNGPYAHYDLGAGGRLVTTDCHDASDATGDQSSNPHCWAGGQLQGISVGINRRF